VTNRLRQIRLLTVVVICLTGLIVLPAQAENSSQAQLERGEHIYNRFCSFCHGKDLQGQANWRKRKPDGKLPAPPHDENGHTWHHADELIFGIIKFGLVPPYAPPNYKTDMPAWAGTLSDDDIRAIILYIKSRWPDETKKIQADINNEAFQRLKK